MCVGREAVKGETEMRAMGSSDGVLVVVEEQKGKRWKPIGMFAFIPDEEHLPGETGQQAAERLANDTEHGHLGPKRVRRYARIEEAG